MNSSTDKRSRSYWGLKAPACLFRKWNCSAATMQICQDMVSRREDTVVKAVAGLEGGIVSGGSTCGVVSGGALGIALMHDEALQNVTCQHPAGGGHVGGTGRLHRGQGTHG